MSAKRHDEKGLTGGEKGKEEEGVMAQIMVDAAEQLELGGPQEVKHRGTAPPIIRQQVPHSPLPLRLPRLLLDPYPQLDLLDLPSRAVLKEVVTYLLHTTVVIWILQPVVVVRPVLYTLQIHTCEGMSGLELVET